MQPTWNIPPGYTIGTYQDGKQYLVPTFLVKATDLAIRAQELKGTYKVFQASSGPLSMEDLPHVLLGNGNIMAPPLPSLTERELLLGHAEIKAVQEKFGLSYKDAAHRLYHTESRAQVDNDVVFRTFSQLRQGMDERIIHDITERIKEIDAGQMQESNYEASMEYEPQEIIMPQSAMTCARMDWIQDGLHMELNYAFTWIGLSTASGQIVDVPIVIRYLALWLQQEKCEAIWKNTEFLLCLDAGNHPIHPTGIVEHYHCDWWTKDVAPSPCDIINDKMLPECMEIHRKYQNSWWRPKQGLAAMPSSHRQLAPVATSSFPCDHCAAYRTVGMNALRYLHKLRNQTHLHESSFDYTQRNYARRAYTYNRLYEEALLKEAKNTSASYVASGIGATGTTSTTAAGTTSTAAMTKIPGCDPCPSLKWTWGVDITPDDIAKMFRAADREYAVPHSGYDCSLTGSLPGEYSDTSSAPTITKKSRVFECREQDIHTQVLDVMRPPSMPQSGTLAAAPRRAISLPPSGTPTAPDVMNGLLPTRESSKPAMQSGTVIRTDVMQPPSIPAIPPSGTPTAPDIEPSSATAAPPAFSALDVFHALKRHLPNVTHKEEEARQKVQSVTGSSAKKPKSDAVRAFSLLQQKRQEENCPGATKEALQALRRLRDSHR
ncbi:hypothetical protein F5887DRAFT_924092 [Amanita rubescens]|nr:hypothetical protein F5887DRAFT_924092 [Amanita rubescens]